MGKAEYSLDLCRKLSKLTKNLDLVKKYRPRRYDAGDVLSLQLTTVWPETQGVGQFRVEKFVGGGFAGQVYRCVLESLSLGEESDPCGLEEGRIYAIKIMLPPTRFSTWFRDALYWIAFQAPFSASVNDAACRAGLLWPKLLRYAMASECGDADAVADAHASFYDEVLGSYGEVREWVEGRTWRLEPDLKPWLRWKWKYCRPQDSQSPEFVAKRQFMSTLVAILHKMGSPELARQYEWWTLKSQPNVLKRLGFEDDPARGLCAVDFRAGLALLPFFPMSPRDIGLIVGGIFRGSLAQFDRFHYEKLRRYWNVHPGKSEEITRMAEALIEYDRRYRRSMPDLSHQCFALLVNSELRREVRYGLIEGYLAKGLIDTAFAERLRSSRAAFNFFYLLGIVPLLGVLMRRIWGNADHRKHVGLLFSRTDYRCRAVRAGAAHRLIDWHRSGRSGENRSRYLAEHPWNFWIQRCTLGLLPAKLHRPLAEPKYIAFRYREAIDFIKSFYRDADFRERWLTDLITQGYEEGMLDKAERDSIMSRIRDPFIIKYLKCLAVHFATLPITQIVSVIVASVVAVSALLGGATWANAGVRFAVILGLFQVTPISPGSLCRGAYVVYLMVRERDFKSYMIAAPISFVKYIGYLAFPFQMVTSYPALSRFMASRWATGAVHIVPVFGEKGALLEHFVFDSFFNLPRILGIWAGKRLKGLLTVWALIGLAVLAYVFYFRGVVWYSGTGINILLAVVVLTLLPRMLFYPLLRRRRAGGNR